MAKKTKSYGLNNPFQDAFPVPVVSKRPPEVYDMNYEIGQIWVDQKTARIYGLAAVSSGEASWSILGIGSTGDAGGAISPTGGNINIPSEDGQLLIGATGAEPSFSNITSVDGTITITPGANTLNIEMTPKVRKRGIRDE